MKYYIDKIGKLYDKSGIDYLIENALNVPDNLVVATTDQVNAVLNPEPTTEQLNAQAKATRNDAIERYKGTVEFNGALFDSSKETVDNINYAVRRASQSGATSAHWRLADNSWLETTLDEIVQVRELVQVAVDENFENVWNQFTTWDNGDKHHHFKVVP